MFQFAYVWNLYSPWARRNGNEWFLCMLLIRNNKHINLTIPATLLNSYVKLNKVSAAKHTTASQPHRENPMWESDHMLFGSLFFSLPQLQRPRAMSAIWIFPVQCKHQTISGTTFLYISMLQTETYPSIVPSLIMVAQGSQCAIVSDQSDVGRNIKPVFL